MWLVCFVVVVVLYFLCCSWFSWLLTCVVIIVTFYVFLLWVVVLLFPVGFCWRVVALFRVSLVVAGGVGLIWFAMDCVVLWISFAVSLWVIVCLTVFNSCFCMVC